MSCLECTDCPDIGTFDICADSVVIGYTTPSTAIAVVITDVTLDRPFRFTMTTPVSGAIALPTAPIDNLQEYFAIGRTYEVRAYASYTGGPSPNLDGVKLPLTLPPTYTTSESCFSFQFKYIIP
jgi:hypothetical protein